MNAATIHARRFASAVPHLDRRTWLRSLHLVTDLPLGIVAFSAAATALSACAGLLVTVAGVPLLVLTLAAANAYARLERRRVRLLLGVDVAAPSPRPLALHPREWLRALGDASAWKALLHALVALPLGVVNATVVVTGWVTGIALAGAPLAAAWLSLQDQASSGLLTNAVDTVLACVAGVLLLAVLPAVVRGLAALDAFLAQLLLGSRSGR